MLLRAWRAADGYDPRLSSLRTWLFAMPATSSWTRPGGSPSGPGSGRCPTARAPTSPAWGRRRGGRRRTGRGGGAAPDRRGPPDGDPADPPARPAAELGIPVGTLRSRVFYGMRALRLAMEEMGVEP
ncbi:hypothetical protein [Geodermatophilus sp. URMC 60]